jgi:ubiquinone/menaquinone biosynthesis C-methylase UbiE
MLYGKEYFYPFFADGVRRVAQAPVVLELGTTHRFRKELRPFRHEFKGRYYALDYGARPDHGADNVNVDGDIQHLPFRSESVEGVLCVDCLSCVPRPDLAVEEIYRVLKPGGVCFLKTSTNAPFMSAPGYYNDLYRFSKDCLAMLFKRFAQVTIQPGGALPYMLFYWMCPTWLRPVVLATPFRQVLEWFDRRCSGNVSYHIMVLAVK